MPPEVGIYPHLFIGKVDILASYYVRTEICLELRNIAWPETWQCTEIAWMLGIEYVAVCRSHLEPMVLSDLPEPEIRDLLSKSSAG
jgi:hypothetical protein